MMSWQQIYRDSLRNNNDLKEFFGRDFPETSYKIMIPRPLAHKIKEEGMDGILAHEFLPHINEDLKEQQVMGLCDPIGDHQKHIDGTMLVHRYKNRALLLPTHLCPVACRYCFRKNELDPQDTLFKNSLDNSFDYLKMHKEIHEIILSGGDPLVLSDKKLTAIIEGLASIPSIKYLRFHTRMPVIIPERLTQKFFELLQYTKEKFKVVSFVVHVNHASEMTNLFKERIENLRKLNINLLSQTVFLKGVNNSVLALVNLFTLLLEQGIRPYYLHHPDLVRGAMHFRISIEEGRAIYRELRGELPGHAIPQYILDIPGGQGKVPLFNPESHEFKGELLGLDGKFYAVQNS